jgi:alkanesulfonate monooxygenase SsuD/methylene tetrahydromethanopterin reductase-like flavin-dependent oxidoreductase (luciferase family)
MLMAAASATTTLRVGGYVYINDFRHPAWLAKEAATIDVLSDGRLELGVSAAWSNAVALKRAAWSRRKRSGSTTRYPRKRFSPAIGPEIEG